MSSQPQLEYGDSPFALYDDRIDGYSGPDLANSIHPLFHKNKFININNASYQELDMPLRLASKLLEDDRAAEYIVTLVDGPLHYLSEYTGKIEAQVPDGLDLRVISDLPLIRLQPAIVVAHSSDAIRQRSREILLHLVKALDSIQLANSDAGDLTQLSPYPMPNDLDSIFHRSANGNTLWIHLSNQSARSHRSHPANSVLAMVQHAHLAFVLVHEVMHVLSAATHGDRGTGGCDMWCEPHICNEVGFNLELALFGGINNFEPLSEIPGHPIRISKADTDSAPIMIQYPAQRWIDSYAALPNAPRIYTRVNFDGYHRFTRVPRLFLANMFTEDFWNTYVPTLGLAPIRPDQSAAPPARWIFKDVKQNEVYKSATNIDMRARVGKTVACTRYDKTLPKWVMDELTDIAYGR